MKIILGIFIILHGLVHWLYFGHSNRYFSLKAEMTWPSGSWLFSPLLAESTIRYLASGLIALAGIGFMASGIGIMINQAWYRVILITSSLLSAIIYILFWNGTSQNLDGQGLVGIIIDIALLVMVMLIR